MCLQHYYSADDLPPDVDVSLTVAAVLAVLAVDHVATALVAVGNGWHSEMMWSGVDGLLFGEKRDSVQLLETIDLVQVVTFLGAVAGDVE